MGINPRRFVDGPLPNHLLCPSCSTTLDDGVITCVCRAGRVLCTMCSLRHRSICRQGLTIAPRPATEIHEEIGGYCLRCIDPKCQWVGPARDEMAHRSTCQHRVVLCELCNTPIRYNEQAHHLSKVCVETRVVCERGGEDCGGPGLGIFYRKNSSIHDQICSNFPCSVPGCPTRTSIANLPDHQYDCRNLRQTLNLTESRSQTNHHFAKIHHANASLLVDTLSNFPPSVLENLDFGTKTILARAQVLYPEVLDYPISSSYLLQTQARSEAKEPVTPVTPNSEDRSKMVQPGSRGGGGTMSFPGQASSSATSTSPSSRRPSLDSVVPPPDCSVSPFSVSGSGFGGGASIEEKKHNGAQTNGAEKVNGKLDPECLPFIVPESSLGACDQHRFAQAPI